MNLRIDRSWATSSATKAVYGSSPCSQWPATCSEALQSRQASAPDGQTTLALTHHGIPAGSPGAAGWAMALDDLAARVPA
jgi:hypothetical protein